STPGRSCATRGAPSATCRPPQAERRHRATGPASLALASWGSSRDFGRTADNCVRSESVVLFWLTMVSNETIVFERMKTSQISTRVTQADADFLAGLTLEGATTPSDKVRALITEARRRREELGDYKGSLRQVRDLIGPATAAILEAENTSSAHSAVVLPLVDWLAEALAF